MDLEEMIAELERLCPGCKFVVDATLVGAEVIHIDEAGHGFTVNLAGLGVTVEEWFQNEIERRPGPPPIDAMYKVNCGRCGSVVLGYIRYVRQMSHPDDCWFCPRCGGRATFDDENYESYSDQGETEHGG